MCSCAMISVIQGLDLVLIPYPCGQWNAQQPTLKLGTAAVDLLVILVNQGVYLEVDVDLSWWPDSAVWHLDGRILGRRRAIWFPSQLVNAYLLLAIGASQFAGEHLSKRLDVSG
ncbi:uncharacterized protein TrAtP1_008942 [Trichoderma atroviride]|uniref:uncharacterized protein n=1 Tax=Hypocrea atroviridis TaxID=63577 RepID=UPI0033330838|nr:hypothetical protein TrAtP1_008942 [Trichoderma atroviride]